MFVDALPDLPVFYFELVFNYFHEFNRGTFFNIACYSNGTWFREVCLNMKLWLLLSKFLFLDVNTFGLLEGKSYVHSMKVNLVELVLIEVIFKNIMHLSRMQSIN